MRAKEREQESTSEFVWGCWMGVPVTECTCVQTSVCCACKSERKCERERVCECVLDGCTGQTMRVFAEVSALCVRKREKKREKSVGVLDRCTGHGEEQPNMRAPKSTYTKAYSSTWTYTQTHTRRRVHTHTLTNPETHAHARTHARVHTHTHTHTHARENVPRHTNIHTRTHTHVRARKHT